MATGTQMVLEAKKNKLNNSSKWFTFGHKKTVVSGYGLFACMRFELEYKLKYNTNKLRNKKF